MFSHLPIGSRLRPELLPFRADEQLCFSDSGYNSGHDRSTCTGLLSGADMLELAALEPLYAVSERLLLLLLRDR